MKSVSSVVPALLLTLTLVSIQSASAAPEAFRRDPGHPQWHHGAFHDVKDSVRSDVRHMLHTRAEVFFFPLVQRKLRENEGMLKYYESSIFHSSYSLV